MNRPMAGFLMAAALCAFSFTSAVASPPPGTLSAEELAKERAGVEQWKARRLKNLTSETGWLTLAGLYWLQPGKSNTFGRAEGNRLRLDHPALAERAGTFELKKDGTVQFVARPGSGVTHDGKPVSKMKLSPDTSGQPTLLKSGSLTFFVIQRGDRIGIRVRDSENPHRRNFAGLDYFPVNDGWVFDARFEPYEPSRKVTIVNILGMEEHLEAPGALVFTKDGTEYRLDAVLEDPSDDELFVMFADGTSGHETYGAGRFLYVPKAKDGVVRLNFNRAYNPPCAFNEFATCPLPPRQNRLAVRIEAGEKSYAGGH